MCEEHSPYSDFIPKLKQETGISRRRMPIDWIEGIFLQAKSLGVTEIIPSTMGEPLLYSGFNQIIELCKTYMIQLNLTTNGTFPKKTMSEWSHLIIPICTDIKISWNGATKQTAESIMKGISFEKTLENIKQLIEYRNEYALSHSKYCRITFQLTFLENNMQELKDIIRLAAEMGVDRVKGHHLWAHFKEIRPLSMKANLENLSKWNQYIEEVNKATEMYKRADGNTVLLENFFYLDPNQSNQIPDNYECPFLAKELWISPTGKISPCCAPDQERQKLGDFGNIQTQSLKEILESERYKRLVANYKSFLLCQNCNMRKPIQNV
jgi:radical SAM protein with 4Fe4S-binding SPASM domain